MSELPRVTIHYRRPPDRKQVFDQAVVFEDASVIVTLAEAVDFDPAMRIDGEVALESGSSVVWFTFPGAWHDIGRFHRADGTFVGYYANVITPVDIDGRTWHTTDLYLDVWLSESGRLLLLDEEEFDEAIGSELIDFETAARVREEARRIMREAEAGTWPPRVVREWTLERALGRIG